MADNTTLPTQTSIRGNSLPSAGAMATTGTGQSQPLLPDTITLLRMSEMFQERSEQNCIKLNQVSLIPGQQIQFTINNVGLGESLDLLVNGSISFANTLGSAQVISLSPEFPFNLFSNILTQFNGQTVIDSLNGYELLGIMSKRNKNVFQSPLASAGSAYAQTGVTIAREFASVTAGANCTITTTSALTLTGVASISIAATSTGIVNFQCYLNLPYVLRQDLLLGLLPLQNNSIYANVSITCPTVIGATPASPLYVSGGVPATLTNSANAIVCQPTYNFWAIPSPNDARLYSFLVSHSYMLLSQPNNSLNKTGQESLQFNIPNNFYLLSILATLRDGNGALVDCYNFTDNPYLSYNGTARVERRDIKTRQARQRLFYDSTPTAQGQIQMDFTDLTYVNNSTNTSKWLNMYLANNPQFIADVSASVALPASYNILREQLVPAQVQIV
jgi:hypothetical protein